MTIFNILREQRTPTTEVDLLLTNLSAIYGELLPKEPDYSFINTYFKDMYCNEATSGDDLVKFNETQNKTSKEGIGHVTELVALVISCAYCVEALRAEDIGEINCAWTFVIDAKFWCTIPLSRRVGRVESKEKQRAISEVRAKITNENKYEKFYKRPIGFVNDMYTQKQWESRASAARYIAPLLEEHMRSKNWKFWHYKGEEVTDLYNWVYGKLKGLE